MKHEKITERETIALLLYLLEDLKKKVLKKQGFEIYQLPTINSIVKCIEESYVLPLEEKEFRKIIIDTKYNILYPATKLQL